MVKRHHLKVKIFLPVRSCHLTVICGTKIGQILFCATENTLQGCTVLRIYNNGKKIPLSRQRGVCEQGGGGRGHALQPLEDTKGGVHDEEARTFEERGHDVHEALNDQ